MSLWKNFLWKINQIPSRVSGLILCEIPLIPNSHQSTTPIPFYLGCSEVCPHGERHAREEMAAVKEMPQRGERQQNYMFTVFYCLPFFPLSSYSEPKQAWQWCRGMVEINPQEASAGGWFQFSGWVLSTSSKQYRACTCLALNRWWVILLGLM